MNLFASRCVNTDGSYYCECLENYRSSGKKCIPKAATLRAPTAKPPSEILIDACLANFQSGELFQPVFLNAKFPANITIVQVATSSGFRTKLTNINHAEFYTVVVKIEGFDVEFFNLDEDWMLPIATLEISDGHRSFTTLKNRPMKRKFKIILTNHSCRRWKEALESGHFSSFMTWIRTNFPVIFQF